MNLTSFVTALVVGLWLSPAWAFAQESDGPQAPGKTFGLALDVDAELTEVDGCCIFVGTGAGLLGSVFYVPNAFRFGGGVRLFQIISSNTGLITGRGGPSPVGADLLAQTEYRFTWGRMNLAPGVGLGAEGLWAAATSFSLLIEPSLSAAVYVADPWAVHIRLAVSLTPQNQAASNPLSYVRLGLGLEWGRL